MAHSSFTPAEAERLMVLAANLTLVHDTLVHTLHHGYGHIPPHQSPEDGYTMRDLLAHRLTDLMATAFAMQAVDDVVGLGGGCFADHWVSQLRMTREQASPTWWAEKMRVDQ